jgi:hypothetical protein
MRAATCPECSQSFTKNRSKQVFCSYRCSGAANARKGKITPPEVRFWAKVNKTDGCWLWTAGVHAVGYGRFGASNGVTVSAHRYSYEQCVGPIPDGMLVCHRCDNRLCVRPDHLFLGTHEENTRDAMKKGRLAKGERAGSAKLTAEIVRAIFLAAGTQDDIAARFGVSQGHVWRIKHRRAWKHVTSDLRPESPA